MGLLRPSQLSVFCSAGQRCTGDRSSFCRIEALKHHCSLPDFQRMCCKSCNSSGGVVPMRPTVLSPLTSTSSISHSITSVRTTLSPWTISHSTGPHSTHPPLTSTHITTTTASIGTPVLSIAFSTPGTPDTTTSQPLPLPAPGTDVNTHLQSDTLSPTTSGVVVTTFTPAVTTPAVAAQSPVKSKPKKNNSQKKKTSYIKPPKINAKKDNALKNTTTNDLPNTKPKKQTNDLARNSNQEETATKKAQTNTTPKKSTLANATPKKPTPNKPLPKKTPPKTKPKKNIQPKTNAKKPAQPKTNLPEKPKSTSKKFQNSQAKFNQTHPRNNTLETRTLSYHVLASSLKPEVTIELLSSTIPSSTGVSLTAVAPDPSEGPPTGAHTPLWYPENVAATPSSFSDVTPTQSMSTEDVNVSSGTVPYSNSGDVPVTSGALLSGDDITVSFSNVAVVSDSMVLDDGLAMIPTINSEDMTDVASSPWLDQSEFIPVNVPVPTSLLGQTTVAPATEKHTVDLSTQSPQRRPDESNNNLIDIDNKNTGVDGDVPQNNQIPKRRVNFRERTKNKRIQELLEEKRNFLLRMKRGHAA